MNIQTVKSAGGIEAWLVEEHAVPILALRFAFDGGATQDPAGKEGLANFVAPMLCQGAGDLDSIAFQEHVKDLSARLGLKAGRDTVIGSLEALSESRAASLQLLKLALTEPRFDADAVERVRQQLKVGIARASREPGKVAAAEWDAIAFAGHPYARPISGTASSVDAITADDLKTHYRRGLARDTLKVVAVGDITPGELGTLLDEVFGGLPAKNADLAGVTHVDRLPSGRQSVIEMDVPQSAVTFGLQALPRHDPDYVASVVLNHIVGGGGFSSRLMEEVRVKRGLAYSVSSAITALRYASVLRGGVATRNDLVGQSIDIIRTELTKVSEGAIDARDLESAKRYLIGSYPLLFDTSAKIAMQLLGLRTDGFGPDYIANRNGMVAAVTLDDLKRVAARLFDPDNLIISVVGKPSLRAEHAAPQVSVSAA